MLSPHICLTQQILVGIKTVLNYFLPYFFTDLKKLECISESRKSL